MITIYMDDDFVFWVAKTHSSASEDNNHDQLLIA